MTEEKKDYITEAMDLLHGTTLEISSPEKVIERRDGKLVEVERSAFVKIFTSFKRELKTISGDELKVWLYLALSINRFSKTANPGLRKIAEDTGLAVNTVRGIVERLEMSQLLDVEKADGKGNQYRPADYASVSKFDTVPQTVSKNGGTVSILEPTVSTLRGENAQLELTRETRETTLSEKDLEQVNKKFYAIINNGQIADNSKVACESFEFALFGSLVNWPWDSNSKWQKFAKWVSTQDPALFVQYSEWRKGDGKFHAMSNNKIRQDPQMFMDTGWPTFLAHVSMYKPKDKGFAL